MVPKIIQWIKLNLVVVICGSLAVLSLTALVLGMILPDAQSLLEADKAVLSNLESAGKQAANERTIEELRRKQNDIRRSVQRYLDESAKSNPHALPKWGNGKDGSMLFPKPRPDEPMVPNEFVDVCAAKRRELLALLRAQDRPSDEDVKEYKDAIDKARQKEKMEKGETPKVGMFAPASGMGGTAGSPGVGAGGGFGGGAGYGTGQGGSDSMTIPENMTPDEWVKTDAKAGAAIKRAHEVYCYAGGEALDFRNQIPVGTRFPPVEAMWLSQVSLWIQEDIVQSLARLNNEVAGTLPEQERWVANLPVKHLLYISLGDLVAKPGATGTPDGRSQMSGGGLPTTGGELARPEPPVSGTTFVNRTPGDGVDVIPLAIGLVIDAGYLVRVVDEIGKLGFFTPVLVNYEVAEPNAAFQDYIYGSAPIVRVRLEFEHYIIRDKLMIGDKKYVDLMPASIKDGTYVQSPAGMMSPGAPSSPGSPFGTGGPGRPGVGGPQERPY